MGAALRQANNSLNTAVQMLQEEPELISLAAQERSEQEERQQPTDEMIASVVDMGFLPEMALTALKNEGSIEAAVEKLMEGGGVVQEILKETIEKKREQSWMR